MTWTTRPRSELTSGLTGWRCGENSGVVSGEKGGRECQRPSMVLIHGVGLRGESWGAMLPHLVPHFEVVVPDLPGHGESPRLADDTELSLCSYTNTMADLLHQLDRPSIVVGHSLGALIALDLAVKLPDQVSMVVPLNAIYRRTDAAADAVKARAAELKQASLSDPSPTIARWFGNQPQGNEAQMAHQCRDWLMNVDPDGYRDAYHVFAHEDGPTNNDLQQMASPALFITGANEPNSTPEMSNIMAGLAPLGRAIVIEDARHMMPMTHAQEVCGHIRVFHRQMSADHV
ncbi:MAG: alpha/beta hydrolase [Rhizobiaceae bacterium]